MVAERVGRPVLQEVHDRPDRPVGWAAAAMSAEKPRRVGSERLIQLLAVDREKSHPQRSSLNSRGRQSVGRHGAQVEAALRGGHDAVRQQPLSRPLVDGRLALRARRLLIHEFEVWRATVQTPPLGKT